jgi:hypothetical protein
MDRREYFECKMINLNHDDKFVDYSCITHQYMGPVNLHRASVGREPTCVRLRFPRATLLARPVAAAEGEKE